MANSVIGTQNFRFLESQNFVSRVKNSQISLYLMLGTYYDSGALTMIDDLQFKMNFWSSTYGLLLIGPSNICQSIPTINWTTGNYYDMYRHDYNNTGNQGITLSGTPTNRANLYQANFYVLNSSNNLYKCLFNQVNNVVVPSTVMPTGTSTTEFMTSDGYYWKYMGTIVPNDAENFLISGNAVDNYCPAFKIGPNPGSTSLYYNQYLVEQSAVNNSLSIKHCVITNQGSGYSSTPTVLISGDGTGAVGSAIVVSNKVVGINIISAGTGYTYATVSFSGGGGSSAAATAIISPVYGHGFNLPEELGAMYACVSLTMIPPNVGTYFPVVSSYLNAGLIVNPYLYGTNIVASGFGLRASKIINFTSATGAFSASAGINGLTSGASASTISYDPLNSYIQILQSPTTGKKSFQVGETIRDTSNGTTASISSITNPDVQLNSGTIIYMEKFDSVVTRTVDQFEQIRIPLSF